MQRPRMMATTERSEATKFWRISVIIVICFIAASFFLESARRNIFWVYRNDVMQMAARQLLPTTAQVR